MKDECVACAQFRSLRRLCIKGVGFPVVRFDDKCYFPINSCIILMAELQTALATYPETSSVPKSRFYMKVSAWHVLFELETYINSWLSLFDLNLLMCRFKRTGSSCLLRFFCLPSSGLVDRIRQPTPSLELSQSITPRSH